MNILEQFLNSKRSSHSALSKTLAQYILNGQTGILLDCIELASYEPDALNQKHVRTGAAKVVGIVALNRPDLVAPYLQKLIPALSAREPQTRGMIIRTAGFCAHLNNPVAKNIIAHAAKYIDHKEGLNLASAADLFLGDYGAISKEDAKKAFSILERSMANLIASEQDSILEALFKMFQNLDEPERERCFEFAERWQSTLRKSTQQRATRILRLMR